MSGAAQALAALLRYLVDAIPEPRRRVVAERALWFLLVVPAVLAALALLR